MGKRTNFVGPFDKPTKRPNHPCYKYLLYHVENPYENWTHFAGGPGGLGLRETSDNMTTVPTYRRQNAREWFDALFIDVRLKRTSAEPRRWRELSSRRHEISIAGCTQHGIFIRTVCTECTLFTGSLCRALCVRVRCPRGDFLSTNRSTSMPSVTPSHTEDNRIAPWEDYRVANPRPWVSGVCFVLFIFIIIVILFFFLYDKGVFIPGGLFEMKTAFIFETEKA